MHHIKAPGDAKTKTVIIVAGPTAVGKTAVAIALARYFSTEIISADSRQCYTELNIGVARPSPEELQAVPHHFIATHSIHDKVDAVVFEQYALQTASELFRRHDTVLVAGGTGLYIKAFCEGLDEIPAIPPDIRNTIIRQYADNGLGWLQERVKQTDPAFYQVGEIQNPVRLMRALEIMEATGQSVLHFRKGNKAQRDFNIVKIGLELPREALLRNIHVRTEKMIEAGLTGEVEGLLPYRDLNALHTVGYTEIFEYLDRHISLDKAVESIRINTRQYAKRQMTWFRKDKENAWFSPERMEEIVGYILNPGNKPG